MIPISALLVALTADQVRAVMVQALVNLGIRADLWLQGGTASTILTVVATTYAGFTQTMVAALSAGFLPTATGSWLVLLAYYVYGVTATAATFGTGQVTLTNTGGGIFTYAARQAVFGNSDTGLQYVNVNAFTLNGATMSGPTSITIDVVATTQGTAGNANPGEISVMVTSMQNVTVTNAGAVVGLDAQSDASLRSTCLNKLAALSVRAPRNAYKWAITTAVNPTTNAQVNINRVQVLSPGATYVNGVPLTPPNAGAPGTTTIYAASPSGAPSSDDLNAAGANIEQMVRPDATTAALSAATEVPYTRTLVIWARALPGLTASAVTTPAATAITNLFAGYDIGGVKTDSPSTPTGFYGTAITGAIIGTNPSAIFFVEDFSNPGKPPPDLALGAGQVATDDIQLQVRFAPVSSS